MGISAISSFIISCLPIFYLRIYRVKFTEVFGSVSCPFCVKIGNGMQSNTTVSIKLYFMAIPDNYMFRSLLAIFRLSYENLTYGRTIHIERARGAEIST